MKKLLSIVFIMAILSINFAVTAKNEDDSPYSLSYLENIDGVKYIDCLIIEDIVMEDYYSEQNTIEMYDISSRILKNENRKNIIDSFIEAFINNGFDVVTQNDTKEDLTINIVRKVNFSDYDYECFLILGEEESKALINESGIVCIEHSLLHLGEENMSIEDKMANKNNEKVVSTLIVFSENGNISIALDNHSIEFDTKPQMINGKTMVPLRAIFEAFGATVDWDEDSQTVTATKNETTISLTINNESMFINGNEVTLDSPACIIDGRTLVPVRAVSEAFNIQVEWKEAIPQTPVVYDDLSVNVKQINDMIKSGLYLEAIQECEQTVAWHNCSPDDINLLNSLKSTAQIKYDEYVEERKQANLNKKVTDDQKKRIFSIIKIYVEPQLKSKATAIWPDYTDLYCFYGGDGFIHVVGELEAMNSFGGYGKVSFAFRFTEDLNVDWWYIYD